MDTNVVREMMRPRPAEGVLRWGESVESMHLSVVTLEEIWFGLAAKPGARLEKWFDEFCRDYCEIHPITPAIARRTAWLRALRRGVSRPMIQADAFLAGTAAEHGLILVTRNVRDFEGCGIRLSDPFAPR